MIKITIGKEKFNLPSRSNELSIGKYIMINDIVKKDKLTLGDKKSLFSILMGTTVDKFKDVKDEWFNILYDNIPYLTNKETTTKFIKYNNFKLNKQLYTLIDLDKMDVLEYIDLTLLILQKEEDLQNNIEEILNLLIRKVKNKPKKSLFRMFLNKRVNKLSDSHRYYSIYLSNNKLEHEEYRDIIGKKDDNIFDYLPYTVALQIIQDTLDYLTKILKEYPDIYGLNISQAEIYNREKHKEAYSIYNKEVKEEENFKKNPYGLYASLSNICEDDKIKIDYWLSKPFRELLEHMTYIIYKNKNNKNG